LGPSGSLVKEQGSPELKKETITRNCTLYCPTWVFLPFVHVVKSLICIVCTVDSFKLSCV